MSRIMVPFQASRRQSLTLLDGFAVIASIVCMVHCLALPLMLAALPVLSGTLLAGEAFHLMVLAVAVPTSAVALWSWRTPGSSNRPLMAGAAGLSLLAIALLAGETAERAITLAGSLLLAGAHVANWRARRRRG